MAVIILKNKVISKKNSGSVGVNQSLELYLRFYEKTTSSDTAEQNIKKANPYDKYYIVNSSNYTPICRWDGEAS